MRTHACQTTCQCDHESCYIVSPHQGWQGALCRLFISGPAPKVWLVSLLTWLRAPAWDGAPIVKAERWKSALNFNWMESFALFHLQLSTEGQTDAREMQRRSAADRLQKTDALHCTYRVSTVHCTLCRIFLHCAVYYRVQLTHWFNKAQSLSAMVLSAGTWREISCAVFSQRLARLDLVCLPGRLHPINCLPGISCLWAACLDGSSFEWNQPVITGGYVQPT